jgi:protein phosphatase 1L
MTIHKCTEQGKRPYNEDRIVRFINSDGKYTSPKINIFCVFDGHGGSQVSTYLYRKAIPYILKFKQFPLPNNEVVAIFDTLQKEIIEKKIGDQGSTATIVIQFRKRGKHYLQVLNTGDSRAICLSDKGLIYTLSRDHKPNLIYEQERINLINKRRKDKHEVYHDGYTHRVHDLAVSRAFGDAYAAPQVTHKPEIVIYQGEVKLFVIASDGLWDVMTNEEVINFVVKNKKSKDIARLLVDEALKKGSADNISLYVVINDINRLP